MKAPERGVKCYGWQKEQGEALFLSHVITMVLLCTASCQAIAVQPAWHWRGKHWMVMLYLKLTTLRSSNRQGLTKASDSDTGRPYIVRGFKVEDGLPRRPINRRFIVKQRWAATCRRLASL